LRFRLCDWGVHKIMTAGLNIMEFCRYYSM
jgi:hypothetical protein